MRTLMKNSLLLILCGIVGCAHVAPNASYAVSMRPAEADVVAQSLTELITEQLPPASSTLSVAPVQNKSNDVLTVALYKRLRQAGFSISEPSTQKIRDAHSVRYQVTSLNGGLLVRLNVDSTEMTEFFAWNKSGFLEIRSPLTVRE